MQRFLGTEPALSNTDLLFTEQLYSEYTPRRTENLDLNRRSYIHVHTAKLTTAKKEKRHTCPLQMNGVCTTGRQHVTSQEERLYTRVDGMLVYHREK